MAFPTYSTIPLAISMIFFAGFGSGLRVVTQPQPFNIFTKELNISCVVDEPVYISKSIISVQIMRHAGDKPIAVVNMRHELKMAVGVKDNVKAEGHIGVKSNTSYLTLIINRPDRQDAGPYRCQMFYMDKNFQIVEKNVIGNATYQESDITRAIAHLTKQVSSLLTNDDTQNQTIQTLTKQHITFDNIHSKQKLVMDRQNQQIDELKNDNTKKQHQIDILMDNIKHQNETIHELIVSLSQIKKQACLDKGWTHYYYGDQTCLKAFARDDNSKALSWSKARESCQALGGDLVIIRDKEKNNFVHKMFELQSLYPWIGVKNHASRGFNFKYVDGSDLGSYHPWRTGYPSEDDKKCVLMKTHASDSGEWRDQQCSYGQSYVCST